MKSSLDAASLISSLEQFAGRGAGTDAERRAASWLGRQLEDRGRQVTVETFWCRPHWALAQTWHVVLAIAGSLVSVASAPAGVAIVAAALIFLIADALTGISPGRRLTPERASQNVVSGSAEGDHRLRLLITANYDTGRAGLAYRDFLRGPAAGAQRLLGGLGPGALGWIGMAMLWLLITAALRLRGHSAAVGVAQVPPTVGLLLAGALLLDIAGSDWSPGAGDNATGVELALALERAVAISPPRHLAPELVLAGAGDAEGLGLRRYLAARRKSRRPDNTVVIGLAACPSGGVRWWRSDGRLIPLAYGKRLLRLAGQTAKQHPHLDAEAHRGRGVTPALPGRARGIPSIAIGCLDERNLVPASHQPTDTAERVDPGAHARALQFALLLVDAIDAELHERWSAGQR